MNNPLLIGGLLLLFGVLGGKIANRLKFPAVTGYIIIGILIGPSILKFISPSFVDKSILVSRVALSLIAFTIGGGLSYPLLKQLGKSIFWISVFEALGAWLAVTFISLFLFKLPLAVALILGSISCATAPAATVMVLREYHAKGPLTDTLLGVVALDDVWGIISFAISTALATTLLSQNASLFSLVLKTLNPLYEIFGSIILGVVLGLALSSMLKRFQPQADMLPIILGMIILNAGLTIQLDLTPLLSNMALGMVLVNFSPEAKRVFETIKNIDRVIFIAFFVLAGAALHVELIPAVGLLGIGYILFRIAGKAAGVWLGGTLTEAPLVVKNYLSLALVPQAGVAIGLALLARQQFPQFGATIITVVLAATVVYELVGPVCTKLAITCAGEIGKSETTG